ncbi:low affinity iron permease family protein [Paraflavitalea pollutisoli]|uniref:low affinity iron permease family protein n=1 Tax=Paraflavitalea pollutisoli TaxID=3034143 RepID=UPI0023ECDC14|nr:low affinity iron permease family protein [Paraflavitalea sp. H1-2-19X]
MATKRSKGKHLSRARLFDKISTKLTHATGSPLASILAVCLIIGWALCGPLFGFSDTWQLVINTSTTIITFLMVFIIQQTQNKDTMALHLKLNELIASQEKASNRLVDIEDLTEEELTVIKKYYARISKLAAQEKDLHSSHSLDEAEDNHQAKSRQLKKKNNA